MESAAVRFARLLSSSLAQELEQTFWRSPPGPPLQEFSSRFHHTHFFRDRHGDELIERYAIGFRQPRRCILDRRWQLQRIGALAHGSSSFKTSRGSRIRKPKSPAAGSKSRTSCVTNASARPLTAASKTNSSCASFNCGRQRKLISTGSAALTSAARNSSTSSSLIPVASRFSGRRRTSSYSRNKAVLVKGCTLPRATSSRTRLLAPARLRSAATTTDVSS